MHVFDSEKKQYKHVANMWHSTQMLTWAQVEPENLEL